MGRFLGVRLSDEEYMLLQRLYERWGVKGETKSQKFRALLKALAGHPAPTAKSIKKTKGHAAFATLAGKIPCPESQRMVTRVDCDSCKAASWNRWRACQEARRDPNFTATLIKKIEEKIEGKE
jgi:hypothetical protein